MEAIKTIVNKVSVPSEKKTKQKEYLPKGTLPIIDQGQLLIGGYTNDTSKTIICDLPVIVFGDHTCCVKYIDFPFGAGADGIKVIKPKEGVLPKYLFYGIQYLVFNLSNRGYGRHYQHIEKMSINVPPISQQERIVSQIEESLSQLDSAVETLKKTKQQLEVYRQAVLTEAFRLLSNQRPITDYFDISSGLTKNSKRNTFSTKMPYLRVANVYYDCLDLSEIKTIGVTENEIQQTLLVKEDILFVEGNGSKSQIGRVAIWDGSIENILHQNHIIKGRPNGKMLPKYALYYLMSNYGRNQILKVASSTSGLYTLSTNKIRNLQIPYCDLATQQKTISMIEEKISLCKSIEKAIDQTLQQAEALRQGILKNAFKRRETYGKHK